MLFGLNNHKNRAKRQLPTVPTLRGHAELLRGAELLKLGDLTDGEAQELLKLGGDATGLGEEVMFFLFGRGSKNSEVEGF